MIVVLIYEFRNSNVNLSFKSEKNGKDGTTRKDNHKLSKKGKSNQ